MPDMRNSVVHLGDASLSREEAIKRALQITVSNLPRDQQPNLKCVKTFVLHKGPIVTKVARFWEIRSSSTGEVRHSSFKFETLRSTKERGWELELHHSFSPSDKSDAEAVEKPHMFFSSMNSLDTSGEVRVFSADTIDIEKLGEALKIVSRTGQQSEFFSKFLEWIQEDPHAQSRLTQLSSDDQHRSQSLVAAINFVYYSKALTRFKEMVEGNASEHDFQKFLQENHWLFGSEYSELLDKRNLVVGQQLDFPLRRTVDGYLDVIEIKTPLDGKSGFNHDRSHDTYYPSSEVLQGTSQVLNYLASLEAGNYQILAQNKIDVTRVRGKLIIGIDGSEEEQKVRRLFNQNSVSVEVISFDGLIKLGQRILEIMVDESPSLLEMHSKSDASDDIDIG